MSPDVAAVLAEWDAARVAAAEVEARRRAGQVAELVLADARAAAEADPDNAQAAMNLAGAEHRARRTHSHTNADGAAASDPHPGTPEPGDAL